MVGKAAEDSLASAVGMAATAVFWPVLRICYTNADRKLTTLTDPTPPGERPWPPARESCENEANDAALVKPCPRLSPRLDQDHITDGAAMQPRGCKLGLGHIPKTRCSWRQTAFSCPPEMARLVRYRTWFKTGTKLVRHA